MTILTAGGVNSINAHVHIFFLFCSNCGRNYTVILGIDRVGGFLQSHGSDFRKVFFFAKICVFVANVHQFENNKADCKNLISRRTLPIHVYCVCAKFCSKIVLLLFQVK